MSGRQNKALAAGRVGEQKATATVGPPRRGRPPKFGRPAQVVAVTLPEEVVAALRTIDDDLGWAIVRLAEPILKRGSQRRPPGAKPPLAELAYLPGRKALIVVARQAVTNLPGVDAIPLSDGRAFLALEPGCGIADLELAILDRLEATPPGNPQRKLLTTLREIVRDWRRNRRLVFRAKSIIVVEGAVRTAAPPLALQHAGTASVRSRRSRTRAA